MGLKLELELELKVGDALTWSRFCTSFFVIRGSGYIEGMSVRARMVC